MDFFVIRDAESHGDVATVWNYKHRGWRWDLDGDYTADDGFAYANRKNAGAAAARIIARGIEFDWGRERAKGVRVVTRNELKEIRTRD